MSSQELALEDVRAKTRELIEIMETAFGIEEALPVTANLIVAYEATRRVEKCVDCHVSTL